MKELGRISHCKIRDVWLNENEFSDWLFSEENIELLSETLGLGIIQTEIREDKVGGFRADIVGEETDTGRKVIIENQFEKSDHVHLGKIITCAAGKDASVIIWIVEDARSEHSSWSDALQWGQNLMERSADCRRAIICCHNPPGGSPAVTDESRYDDG